MGSSSEQLDFMCPKEKPKRTRSMPLGQIQRRQLPTGGGGGGASAALAHVRRPNTIRRHQSDVGVDKAPRVAQRRSSYSCAAAAAASGATDDCRDTEQEDQMSSDELLKLAAMRSRNPDNNDISSSRHRDEDETVANAAAAGAETQLPGAYCESPGRRVGTVRPQLRRGTLTTAGPAPTLPLDVDKKEGKVNNQEQEAACIKALSARLVVEDETTTSRLNEMEQQLRRMSGSTAVVAASIHSACSDAGDDLDSTSIHSNYSDYTCSSDSFDHDHDEEVMIPEARPISSTDDEMDMMKRMSQLEEEMRRLQQELLVQQELSQCHPHTHHHTHHHQCYHHCDEGLIQAFRSSVQVKNRKYHMKKYKNCFVGKQAVDVLVRLTGKSRTEALVMGINMGVQHKLFDHVCDPTNHPVLEDNHIFYRFTTTTTPTPTTIAAATATATITATAPPESDHPTPNTSRRNSMSRASGALRLLDLDAESNHQRPSSRRSSMSRVSGAMRLDVSQE